MLDQGTWNFFLEKGWAQDYTLPGPGLFWERGGELAEVRAEWAEID